ncbi:hypothetical protein P154DRAFT_212279 [Amniculicola lignicola CBS 123094]|uniref:Uncharacterized protein n=1 Tax=Amniculicola lignicola CBS 123094 TaxID=1392246 RepID=A0A6A5WII9_9PLEO|nr:hypothetical protein P154DRAFT_212279 [Amniculicola lignicola CBS 123094]
MYQRSLAFLKKKVPSHSFFSITYHILYATAPALSSFFLLLTSVARCTCSLQHPLPPQSQETHRQLSQRAQTLTLLPHPPMLLLLPLRPLRHSLPSLRRCLCGHWLQVASVVCRPEKECAEGVCILGTGSGGAAVKGLCTSMCMWALQPNDCGGRRVVLRSWHLH